MDKKTPKVKKETTKAAVPKPKAPAKKAPKKEIREFVPAAVALYNLKAPVGAHKKRKYLGRGPSSGHGKTSTRGSKGQTSRAGRHMYLGFEGGQSPLIRKFPKRGFTSRSKINYQIINLVDLNKIKESTITPALLEEKGLIKDKNKVIKVLGEGEIKSPITIQAHAFSKKASVAIRNAGGKVEIINV